MNPRGAGAMHQAVPHSRARLPFVVRRISFLRKSNRPGSAETPRSVGPSRGVCRYQQRERELISSPNKLNVFALKNFGSGGTEGTPAEVTWGAGCQRSELPRHR